MWSEQVMIGLAHAIRNPLGIVLQGVGNLERRFSSERDIADVLSIIKNNIIRCGDIISALADSSVKNELIANPSDINSIIENAFAAIKNDAKFENIEVTKEIQEGLPRILADEKKIREAFSNIFLNAARTMPEGGKLLIRSYLAQVNTLGNRVGRRADDYYRLGEKMIVLEIENAGSDIPARRLPGVFESFFTDKGPYEGPGLGLWVTKNIIESQRGLIQIESKEKKGTKVTVRLRMAE